MRELSLFTGAGGGVLGSLLLGWKTVGYVEYEDYPQRILKQRMDDGILCQAPIFGDIRAFISEGYAESYQGMVDVITAGFPCQPFSVAGKQLGAEDPRNMWPATIDTIRTVRPRFTLLENVSGLLGSGYFGRILGDLAESGYNARWTVLGADDCGAPHRRKRLWILAYTISTRAGVETYRSSRQGWELSHASQPKVLRQGNWQAGTKGLDSGCTNVAYTNGIGEERDKPQDREGGRLEPYCEVAYTKDAGNVRGDRQLGTTEKELPGLRGSKENGRRQWWQSEPNVGRVANGVASRMDRLKAIGNGQVPIVAATAWKLLTEKS